MSSRLAHGYLLNCYILHCDVLIDDWFLHTTAMSELSQNRFTLMRLVIRYPGINRLIHCAVTKYIIAMFMNFCIVGVILVLPQFLDWIVATFRHVLELAHVVEQFLLIQFGEYLIFGW